MERGTRKGEMRAGNVFGGIVLGILASIVIPFSAFGEDKLLVKDSMEAVQFVVTDEGRVGIRTSVPGENLDVNGTVRGYFSGSSTAGDGLTTPVKLSSNNTAVGKSSDTGFNLTNAKVGFIWNFRTSEGTQGFIATKQGTGGPELEIRNTTNDYRNVSLVMGNGAVCTSTGQWLSVSSKEQKEEIEPLSAEEAMAAFQGMTPVKFRFKRDETKDVNVGFIAEEVPELVATQERKGMNALEVVALLTKVMQEQQKTIADLKEEQQKTSDEMKELKRELRLGRSVASVQ